MLAKQKTAFQAFGRDLSQLRISREQQLDYFKSLVSKEQWPWAKKHAVLFVRHTTDLWPISALGNHADYLRSSGGVGLGAKQLLDDIAVLEAEKANELV